MYDEPEYTSWTNVSVRAPIADAMKNTEPTSLSSDDHHAPTPLHHAVERAVGLTCG